MVWSISTVSVSGYLKHRAPRVSIRVGWHAFLLSVCWLSLLVGSKAALVRKHLHSHGHSSSSNSFISESLSSLAAWSCSQLAVGTPLSLFAVVGAGNAMAVQLPVAEDEDPLADAVPGWGGPVNVGSHNPVRFNTAILSRSEALRLDAFLSSLVFSFFLALQLLALWQQLFVLPSSPPGLWRCSCQYRSSLKVLGGLLPSDAVVHMLLQRCHPECPALPSSAMVLLAPYRQRCTRPCGCCQQCRGPPPCSLITFASSGPEVCAMSHACVHLSTMSNGRPRAVYRCACTRQRPCYFSLGVQIYVHVVLCIHGILVCCMLLPQIGRAHV